MNKNTKYEIIASSPWVALKGLRNHRVVIRKNDRELMVHYEIKDIEVSPTHKLVHYFQEGGYYTLSNADALKLAWEDFSDRVERLIRKVEDIESSLIYGNWRASQINNNGVTK